jgi:acyl carrier protein
MPEFADMIEPNRKIRRAKYSKERHLNDTESSKKEIMAFIMNDLAKDDTLAITEDTSLLEEGIIDSTGVMELVAFLEEKFDVKVEDDEIIPDNLSSVNRVLRYLNSKLIPSRKA